MTAARRARASGSAKRGALQRLVGAGVGGFDAIDHFQVRARGGVENIRTDARAPISTAVVFDGKQGLALCIFADGHTVHFERPHLDMNSGGVVDGFDHGVDGSVGGLIMDCDTPVDVRESDRRERRSIVVCSDAQRLQRPRPRGGGVQAHDQRFDIAVEKRLLVVGQRLEFFDQLIEFGVANVETELLDTLAERVSAAMLAEHEVGARQPHILRPHDLVG